MKPKLPKLHIRDLFWLVLVVGVTMGWWVDRARMYPASPMERLERLERELIDARVQDAALTMPPWPRDAWDNRK